MIEQAGEAVTFCLVLFGREWAIVAHDEPGYCAIFGFDDIAELVAFVVDGALAIADVRAGVVDDVDLFGGGIDCP